MSALELSEIKIYEFTINFNNIQALWTPILFTHNIPHDEVYLESVQIKGAFRGTNSTMPSKYRCIIFSLEGNKPNLYDPFTHFYYVLDYLNLSLDQQIFAFQTIQWNQTVKILKDMDWGFNPLPYGGILGFNVQCDLGFWQRKYGSGSPPKVDKEVVILLGSLGLNYISSKGMIRVRYRTKK